MKNLMTALFAFFVALVTSVKQKNSSAVRSTRYLGTHLTNGRTAFRLEPGGRATLNSTGNELSAFCSNLRLQKDSHAIVLLKQLYFEGGFQADFT